MNQSTPVDAVAVYEFWDRLTSHRLRPEQSLMLAILEDACRIAVGGRVHGRDWRMEQQRALHWIYSNEGDWLFSFLQICEELQVNPHKLRRVVAQKAPPIKAEVELPRPKCKWLRRRSLLENPTVALSS